MDKNTLRRMAGITTVSEQLSAPGYKPSFNASEFRRLAGLPTYPTAIPEAAEEEEKAEEESSEEEVPAEEAKEPSHEEIVAAVAEKAEGKTGEELIAIIKDVYDAGFKDGKESMEEKEEEVKESIGNKPDATGAHLEWCKEKANQMHHDIYPCEYKGRSGRISGFGGKGPDAVSIAFMDEEGYTTPDIDRKSIKEFKIVKPDAK